MSDADCTPGREPRSVAASGHYFTVFVVIFISHCTVCMPLWFVWFAFVKSY